LPRLEARQTRENDETFAGSIKAPGAARGIGDRLFTKIIWAKLALQASEAAIQIADSKEIFRIGPYR
jgi:hypothetical protein